MAENLITTSEIKELIANGERLPLAMDSYPSRGQTAVQELYQTQKGKFFLKRVSERNHVECQIDVQSGTLAEREFWAYSFASSIGIPAPKLWLFDELTTVQVWFDCPDGRTYKKSTGKMVLDARNIFDCSTFDWVTGQLDRHDANYLYDFRNGLIIPVDSAHGFLKYEGSLPDYLHLFEIGSPAILKRRISTPTQKRLGELSEDNLKKIVPLRNADEANAFAYRKRALDGMNTIQDLLDLYRSKR
jgi:hypothetical protein